MQSTRGFEGLLLVGGELSAPADSEELFGSYGALFGRLTRDVKHVPDLTRYVGYRSGDDARGGLYFFGIEVDRIGEIPEGMVAWELTERTRCIWGRRDGRDVVVSWEEIGWGWMEPATSSAGRYIGEFTVRPSAGSGTAAASAPREFWLSSHAYVGLHAEGATDDAVELMPYDPSWPRQFDEIDRWLRDNLGPEVALRVEHYGSTAIPGMPAKPIIDVLVEIPSFPEGRKRMIPLCNNELWEYWWYSNHMIFVRREKLMGRRTHHVHMAPRGHEVWEGIAFRDYMRSHPQEAARYAKLKQRLATTHRDDRERYTQEKTEFVADVLSRALGGD
ncbi:MAG: GrpB family protein [bacterium]